jgi:hypothetical protein
VALQLYLIHVWFSLFYCFYNYLNVTVASKWVAPNVLGLAEVGDLLALQLINVQKFNRIPNAQFCTSAPILANPC